MSGNPEDRAQPDGAGVDDQFEAIVAGWRREGAVPQWPQERDPATLFQPGLFEPTDQEPTDPTSTDPSPSDPTPTDRVPTDRVPTRPQAGPPAVAPEDEHFVPPEPPPLPRIGPPAAVGLLLLGLGLLLLVGPAWVGLSEAYSLPLGLVGIAAGLGWLVLRLWPDTPSGSGSGSDRDDGAVL